MLSSIAGKIQEYKSVHPPVSGCVLQIILVVDEDGSYHDPETYDLNVFPNVFPISLSLKYTSSVMVFLVIGESRSCFRLIYWILNKMLSCQKWANKSPYGVQQIN